ncbi:hypothetical protein EON63_00375 [archaeon]|nr:MAG: hypothetical protein EON63_00375 [archaeon]
MYTPRYTPAVIIIHHIPLIAYHTLLQFTPYHTISTNTIRLHSHTHNRKSHTCRLTWADEIS